MTRPEILVTGAAGQVGAAVARLAAAARRPTVALDRSALDVADANAVELAIDHYRPSVVVNAAAYTDVDGSEADPRLAHAVNAGGPANLAAACHRAGAALIHLSTDYVFDGAASRAYHEDDPVAPINVYGESKLAGEEAVRAAIDRHLIVRTSWVFAPGHANFVTTIARLAREREVLKVVADQFGTPTPAAALAAALLALATRFVDGEAVPFGTVHVAGEPEVSRFLLAEAVVRAVRQRGPVACTRLEPVPTTEFPTPARRPASSSLDCSRAKILYGLGRIDWRDYLEAL
jgi:dTDP-4-dehydrorhamnose reductase